MAIKVIRNVDKYRQAAMIEMEVLNTLRVNDADSLRHCIFMREWVRLGGDSGAYLAASVTCGVLTVDGAGSWRSLDMPGGLGTRNR